MEKKPTSLLALDIISIILLGVSTYLALVFAPIFNFCAARWR